MEVKEMHIEINQSLQKQGASVTRKFYADELDWVLNKIQTKFRDSKIRRKINDTGLYEIDQMYTDALRVWTVTDKLLPTFIRPGTNTVYGVLPNDYSYLLSDRSSRQSKCTIGDAYKTLATNNYQLITIPFPVTPKAGSAPYYENLVVTINGQAVYTAPPAGIPNKDDRFVMTNLIIRESPLYWERLGEFYKRNSFMILLPGTTNTASITYDSQTQNGVPSTISLSTYTTGDLSVLPAVNRLTNHSALPDVLSTSFYKTSADSPVSAIDSGILRVFSDGNFTVNGILIDYIRKPRIISLSLNQHCELPEEFHQEICDLAVEFIMNDIADNRAQLKLQENVTRG